MLDSPEIISRINDSSEFDIEIKYPSDDFPSKLQKVSNVKKLFPSKVKITIIYARKESGAYSCFYKNEEIDFVKFDSSVIETQDQGSGSGHGLFENCASLSEVIIPSSMTRIGKKHFLWMQIIEANHI